MRDARRGARRASISCPAAAIGSSPALRWSPASGAVRRRLVETRLRFKRLSRNEVEAYLASGEWRGKAGGYAIQGLAGAFVERLVGSYSNVVGLPLAETAALLAGEGYHVHRRWGASLVQ